MTTPPNKAADEAKKSGPSDSERIARLEEQLAAATARAALAPRTMAPANSGGPGVDVFHDSWSLGAQTAANAGEWHDEWGDKPDDWG